MDAFSTLRIAGNELWRVGALFAVILLGLLAGRVGQRLVKTAARRLRASGRLVPADACEALAPALPFAAFAFALRVSWVFLVLPDRFLAAFMSAGDVLVTLAIGYVLYCLVAVADAALHRHFGGNGGMSAMLVPLVRKSLRVTVVLLTLLQVATILSDKPVTSLLAGLGVGGLAVALAAQETIKNFFGSLVLLADRPFEIGDRIVVDGHDGPVEEVGFRSTRIRTLEGHVVTVPNGELANKTIQNIGKRKAIRSLATLSLTYDTPPAKVQRALDILRDLFQDHEGMDPESPARVYFQNFGAASLDLLVLYWYQPPDYWKFMAFQERMNLEILKRFNDEGIDFAFPTQTLYLAGDAKRPLAIRTQKGEDGKAG